MASRKEEKERRRQERLAQEAAASHGGKRRTYGMVAGAVLVLGVAAAIVAIIASGGGGGSGGSASTGPEAEFAGALKPPSGSGGDLFEVAKKADCTLKNPPIEGREHVDASNKVNYKTKPATSGNHNVVPQPDGVYTATPYPRYWVHSLEGGRVGIVYKPGIGQERIKQLGGLYNDNQPFLLMFPLEDMPYDVAFISWGHLAGCKKVTDETYDVGRAFIERYRDTAPEAAASHQLTVDSAEWPGEVPATEPGTGTSSSNS